MNYAFDDMAGAFGAAFHLFVLLVGCGIMLIAFFAIALPLRYYFGGAGFIAGKIIAAIFAVAPIYILFSYFRTLTYCKRIEWPDYCPEGFWEIVLHASPTVVVCLIAEFVLWKHGLSQKVRPFEPKPPVQQS